MTRERVLRGHASATAASRCASTRSATGSRWPTSTSTSCRGCRWRARFRRADHIGDPARPLREVVREIARARTRRTGPCALLTNLRTLGHCFNPVCFYYLFEPDGETLGAVVAEVTNTPWGDRHAYVLRREDGGRVLAGGHGQARCTSRRSWAWTSATCCARPSRARRCPCTSRTARAASGSSTRRSSSSARPLDRRGAGAPLRRDAARGRADLRARASCSSSRACRGTAARRWRHEGAPSPAASSSACSGRSARAG